MSKRYGCIFGINYATGPNSGNSLNGCITDAKFWATNMKPSAHTDAEHWAKLCGDFDDVAVAFETPQAKMIEMMTITLDKALPGDLVVICYSGHGAILPPGKQTWVPFDFDWNNPDTWLSYDTLDNLFLKHEKAGVMVVVISDSCHSRANPLLHFRDMNPHKMKNRFLPAPPHIEARVVSEPFGRNNLTNDQDDLLLSGCQKNQTSADAEIDGVYHGAFTYSLNEALKKGSKTYHDTVIGGRAYLAHERYDQVPGGDGMPVHLAMPWFKAPGAV